MENLDITHLTSDDLQVQPQSPQKNFKILLLSNAPWVPSGYGVQTKGMAYDWVKTYNTRVLSIYGLQGAWMGVNGLVTYPNLWSDDHGNITAKLIFQSWNPDVFITLYDIFMGAYTTYSNGQYIPIHPHWIAYVMVDHKPIPEKTLTQAAAAYKVVVPTRYGEQQFKSRGVDCEYIPFGIDTSIFKPPADKKKEKQFLGRHAVPLNEWNNTAITDDDFVIVMNGANKDPQRKGYQRMLPAIQNFLMNNPDIHNVKYYIHSWAILSRDLPHLAKMLEIEKYGRICSDYHNLCGVPESQMARIYGAADVFLHLSEGGGFELPILESLACGVPVIGSDFICMTELIKDHGWLIPPVLGKTRWLEGVQKEVQSHSMYLDNLDAFQQIDDEYEAADALEDAYNHPEKHEKYGAEGRVFAQNFDWSLVNPMWHRLFDEIIEERAQKPIESRRMA